MKAIMVCSAIVDRVSEVASNVGGEEMVETMSGEEVIRWALCLVCAWMVVMVGVIMTKWMIEVFFKSGDEGGEAVEDLGEGEEDGEGEEFEEEEACVARGKRDNCEACGEISCEGEKRSDEEEEVEDSGEARSGEKEKGRKKRRDADEGDPCMPDNMEWGVW